MLLTRIWFLLLAIAAIAGVSTALLARGMINREHVANADENLRRDRFEVESLLKLDARARLDTLAPIAADGDVREGVRKGARDANSQKALKDRLRTMNQQLEELRADLLIAVGSDGTILAQEGRRPPREGAGLGKVPLVERALSGYVGDDVWVYDGAVYRMAARPIVDRGQYVGAIVHGQRLDAVLAQRLSERLGGSTVAFFFGEEVIASYTPTDVPGAPTQSEMQTLLPTVLAEERFKKGERTEAYDLAERARAVYSLVAGSASSSNVGYSVARPYQTLPSPSAIFERATKEDLDTLPRAALGGGFALMFLLAMGIMYLERDRPLGRFRAEVDKVARGQSDELDLTVLSRAYRQIGEGVHAAIEKVLEKGGGMRRQQKANLDELLGSKPESLTSAAFSFGSGPSQAPAAVAVAQPMPMPMPAPGPVPMPAPGPVPMPAPVAMPMPMAPPPARPAAPQHSAPTPLAPPPGRVPPPPAPSLVAAQSAAAPNASSFSEDRSVMFKLDGSQDEDMPDEATVVAEVPEYLRDATRENEGHFREVFQQYVELRRQCGEQNGPELTFEKFVVTLRKNRDQIMLQRPDAKDVRFTVYVKAGKASLKATPVRA